MNLGEASAACMQHVWKGTRGETTAQLNSDAALAFFGPMCQLSNIRASKIADWVSALKTHGNGPATINRKLAALSRILRYAFEREDLESMPFIRKMREPEGRKRYLTDEELASVLNFFYAHGMHEQGHAVEVLVDTGMRPSELWRQTRENIVGAVAVVKHTKTDLTRWIPLTNRALFLLREQPLRGLAFPFDNRWLQRAWNKAKHSMNLAHDKEFVVYSLRHTFASRLIQRGAPLHIVQGLLGHRGITTTQRYAHSAMTNFVQAIDLLEPK